LIVGVLVEISNKNVDKTFEYTVPNKFINDIKIGIRVLVPFGKMTLEGFVLTIDTKKTTDKELREILDVIDTEIVLNDELLGLGKKMSTDTLATLISCYQVMLPKALKAKNGVVANIKYDYFYQLGESFDDSKKLGKKQEEIIDLVKQKKIVDKNEIVNISTSSLKRLVELGFLKEIKKEHYRIDYSDSAFSKKELTTEQQEVVRQVINCEQETFLLYGVTGSGKTEVYMEIIDHYLKMGKTSIVLVPEISLTPQMINRFQSRFGRQIAAIHSGLSASEKYDEWRRINRKEARIVIGARSAVFAPLDNIGIIIIDEEHSDSYKQGDSNPHYSAKDIALLRAKYHNASVLLGSATPSLESMARAQKGIYKLLVLSKRVNGKELPEVKIIDMNAEIKNSRGHFSNVLLDEIKFCLNRGEQIILFLNRRGYSSFVSCKNCGYTFKCPNCDITLTYHKSSNTLRCHYCGYGDGHYEKCPSCGEASLSGLGLGTQRIEEEIKKELPNARVLRMDYDTTSKKGMHEKMIEAFKNHEYDILLGTQMVTKGLDFSDVTLVGVINADTSLNIPDFRSSENTFALLSQVAGRSGRSAKEGKVIIQTFNPEHYAIKLVEKHNYLEFYKEEMQIRKKLNYPPYCYLCCLKISGKDSAYIFNEALKMKRSLIRNLENVNILGPSGAMIFKVNNVYRYNIILKYKNVSGLYEILVKIVDHYKSNNKIKIDIDFNPSQML